MRFVAMAVVLAAFIAGCGGGSGASQSEKDQATAAAKQAYKQASASGPDLSAGPCISEGLPGLSDWVADIAHDPRQSVDDQPANQCQSYRSGQAHHFVELTPDGQLIRAQ
jgi:hypothetical protein